MDKRIIISIVLAVVMTLLGVSCTSDREAKDLFLRVEAVMEQQPDSALALMENAHIDHTRLSSDVEGKYALLYTMAQDKSGIDVDDDSLIRIAYEYYKDKTYDSLYAKSQYYMGKCFLLNDSTYAAEMCFNHAIDKGKALKDYKTAYMACYHLSRSLAFSNTNKAIKISKDGLALQERYDNKNIKNHVYLLLCVANVYMYSDIEHKKAFKYLDMALEDAFATKDSACISYTCQDLACSYFNIKNYKLASKYAKEAIRYSKTEYESQQLLYANILMETDSIEQAELLLRDIIRNTTSFNTRYICYRQLSKISMLGNDVAFEYCDSSYVNIEKMYESSMQLRNDYYESTLQKEKDNIALIKKSKKKDIHIIIAISVGLFAISIITLLYIYSKKESKRKMQLEHHQHLLELQHQKEENRRERELEEQKHKLDMEAAEKRHQDEITMREFQLDIMRDSLLSKLAFMKKISKTRDDNKAIRLTGEDWKEIETFLNGVDNLFVERIKEGFPNLKEKDLQFCMLLRLKCSTQDLMNIYCINEQSVKHKKYLFKEKLGIQGEETSAFKFISNF